MSNKKVIKILISIMLSASLVFGGTCNVAFANKPKGTSDIGGPDKDGTIMQYNARPEVVSASWLGTRRGTIAIEYSEEMAVLGRYSVTNINNYEFSNDGGKSWMALSKVRIQSIEAIDINSKVIINLYENIPLNDSKLDMIRISEVADRDDKRTLNTLTTVKLMTHEIDNTRIRHVTAIKRNVITFETDFRILKVNPWAFSYNLGEEIQIRKVEYKNNDHGANVFVYLEGELLDPDIHNLKCLAINTGALSDYFGIVNKAPIKIEASKVLDGIEPTILEAVTIDEDHDARIDGIRITYDEVIKQNLNTTDINVADYTVKRVTIKGKVLKIELNEKKNFDTGSKPFVQLYGEISDLAGNIPVEDTDGILVSDGVDPMLVSAEIIVDGKKVGFGNDSGDVLSFKFSEPVFTKFRDTKYPLAIELANTFECVEDGNIKGIFLSGKYAAKDLGTYPSSELNVLVNTQVMGSTIMKGDLLRMLNSGLVKDDAGHDISKDQGLVRVK